MMLAGLGELDLTDLDLENTGRETTGILGELCSSSNWTGVVTLLLVFRSLVPVF